MKRLLKVAGLILMFVVIAAVAAFIWLALRTPAANPPSTEKIEATPERLARGRYLVEHVSDCVGCHSDHHVDRFGLPIVAGTEGRGGMEMGVEPDFPGYIASLNITPDRETGLGAWTDGEIVRAIREGVSRDGRPLFPMMPYTAYRSMSDDDARAVVAYLRSMKPIRNAVRERELNFPLNVIVRFMPQPLEEPVAHPDPSDRVAYGRYLATIGGCLECHTPRDEKGAPVRGRELAGGMEMKGPWGTVVSANLTPHPETFVGRATREEFIGRFKAFASLGGENAPQARPGLNTVMPWLAYAGMTEDDLGAIYDYLRTVPPVEHRVVTFPQAAQASALPR